MLSDEAAALVSDDKWFADPWLAWPASDVKKWRTDPWFNAALSKVQAVVGDIADPLVYTHYMHFFPGSYRINAITPPASAHCGVVQARSIQ